MKEVYLRKILYLLKTKYSNGGELIDQKTNIKELTGWDSLKHLTFLMDIEKIFKVNIPVKKIATMNRVKDIADYIKRNK